MEFTNKCEFGRCTPFLLLKSDYHSEISPDLGWNDVGWHDEFHQIKTPKLDQFVREESILLTNYYVYRFCSPSRSTFMTGRYPWHIGQQTGIFVESYCVPAVEMLIEIIYGRLESSSPK